MSRHDRSLPIRHRHTARDVALLGEVARTLGIPRSTAYIAARAGELPVEFVAGRYEMPRATLDRLVRERANSLATSAA